MKRIAVLTALLLPALAATVRAAPSIDAVDQKVKKGRKLTVVVTATFDGPGEVRLTGDVNGIPFDATKRVKKAGRKKTKLRVDARRLGLKRLEENLDFDLDLVLTEEGGAETTRDVGRVVPVPLVLVHGLGAELTPGAMEPLAAGLDLLHPGRYEREGRKADLVLFEYDSQGRSPRENGRKLAKVLKKLVRGTSFAKADVVAHSLGGIVARSALAGPPARGKVRKLILLGAPNEGTPLAYLGTLGILLLDGGIPLPEDLPVDVADLAAALLDSTNPDLLRFLYPTYDGWLNLPFGLGLFLPDSTSALEDLDPLGPDPGAEIHAIAFSGTDETFGDLFGETSATVEGLDLTQVDLQALLEGGSPTFDDIPLEVLVLGDGDGVVPLRSALFRDDPAWSAAITEHDLGIGFHVGMYADPSVIAEVAEILGD